MDSTVHRVDLDRRDDVEAGLLEAKAQAARACKKIYAYGARHGVLASRGATLAFYFCAVDRKMRSRLRKCVQ